ncbi:MAG: hypothetical protein EHM13_07310 [Acidobacteria bacterium]|nr:MAG: hypothetical protein EHM13_07310 [Acidobacteriota bacterium]
MARRPVGFVLALTAALLAGPSAPLVAQSGAVATTMTVSVTVIRPCTIEAPASVGLSAARGAGDVKVSCCLSPSTSSVYSGGILPVAGASVPASVSSSKSDTGLVVSVDF